MYFDSLKIILFILYNHFSNISYLSFFVLQTKMQMVTQARIANPSRQKQNRKLNINQNDIDTSQTQLQTLRSTSVPQQTTHRDLCIIDVSKIHLTGALPLHQ